MSFFIYCVTFSLLLILLATPASSITWYRYGHNEFHVRECTPWPNSFNFTQSRAECQSLGADLAVIKDEQTLDWLIDTVNMAFDGGSCRYWYRFIVGLWKPDGELCNLCRNGWEWLDGSALTTGEWLSDQPDAGESYGYLSRYGGKPFRHVWGGHNDSANDLHICSRAFTATAPQDVTIEVESKTIVENEPFKVRCSITPSIYPPAASDTKFTLLVGEQDLTPNTERETESSPKSDGTVELVYQATVQLERTNGDQVQLVCRAEWRRGTNEATTVNSHPSRFFTVQPRTCGVEIPVDFAPGYMMSHDDYPYSVGDACVKTFVSPATTTITVSFTAFDFRAFNDDCSYSSVKIFDGTSAINSNKLAQFCGTDLPSDVTSSSNHLTLVIDKLGTYTLSYKAHNSKTTDCLSTASCASAVVIALSTLQVILLLVICVVVIMFFRLVRNLNEQLQTHKKEDSHAAAYDNRAVMIDREQQDGPTIPRAKDDDTVRLTELHM